MTAKRADAASKRTRRLAMAGWMTAVGLSAVAAEAAETIHIGEATETAPQQGLFSLTQRLSEVVAHPALRGFAHHLLPRPGLSYGPDLPLSRIGDLLPYHSNVRPEELVTALDRLARDVGAGEQVFYPIYDADEIAGDPAKSDTGIFFLRGEPGAPFALVAPGGGFSYVGTVHEGLPYAIGINALGLNAFVIRYRVGMGQQAAVEDMARALSFIFANAELLQISTAGYSVWGSSAGARMAALVGSHGVAAFGGDDVPRPASVIMAYTSHSDLGSSEPPTFVIVGERDGIAPPSAMARRVESLRRMGTPVEFRVVPGIGHGFGTGLGTAAEGWIIDAVEFWQANLTGPAT